MSYVGEICHPEKVLRIFYRKFQKIVFQIEKYICVDGDGKVTFVVLFYAQTLGSISLKSYLTMLLFCENQS